MLTVGSIVPQSKIRGEKDVCILSRKVAETWVKEACMPVKPQNATDWLNGSLSAIVVQSKGYEAIAIDHWGANNYRLITLPQ